MLTGGFTHSFTANNTLAAEGVYTKYDLNKFSSKDKGNDEAGGVKVVSRNQTVVKTDTLKRETAVIYNLNYEYLQKEFNQVERFRSIEFDRDWNRPLSSELLNDQHIASADFGFVKSRVAGVTYGLNLFNEGNNYTGLRHNVGADYKNKTVVTSYNGAF